MKDVPRDTHLIAKAEADRLARHPSNNLGKSTKARIKGLMGGVTDLSVMVAILQASDLHTIDCAENSQLWGYCAMLQERLTGISEELDDLSRSLGSGHD